MSRSWVKGVERGYRKPYYQVCNKSHQPLCGNRRKEIRRKQKRKKRIFQVQISCLGNKSSDDCFPHFQYNISPYRRRVFLSYDATSDLKHNPLHGSPSGKSGRSYRFRILLMAEQNNCLFCLHEGLHHTILYKCPTHIPKRGSKLTTKSPAIEVSGSDIEPNCVRWTVLVIPSRNSTGADSFPEAAKSPSISMLARDTLPDH